MTTKSKLAQQRDNVQTYREIFERRERTIVDLQMVYTTLETRVGRVQRDAEPKRSDERIALHLDRLLDRHRTGRRPLNYLGHTFAEIEIDTTVKQRLKRLDRPDLDLSRFDKGWFNAPFIKFLDKVADGNDDAKIVEAVSEGYRSLLSTESEIALFWSLVLVGVVLDCARLALNGADEDSVTGIRTELNNELTEHVATLETADERMLGADEPDPYVALDWTDPIAMLPIRLETRFREEVLQIRVYPEQLHVDTHEDQLTEDERRWGEAFWTQLWVVGTAGGARPDLNNLLPDNRSVDVAASLIEQLEADEFSSEPDRGFDEVRDRVWAQGVERFGDERAGYVIKALSPTEDGDDTVDIGEKLRKGWTENEQGNVTRPVDGPIGIKFPDIDMRPDSWTRTPRAHLLPDRFVADVYYDADDDQSQTTPWTAVKDGVYERRAGTEFVRRVTGPPVTEPLPVGPNPEAVATDEDATDEMAWMTDFNEAVQAGMGFELPLPDPETTAYSDHDGFSRLIVTGAKTSMDSAESGKALSDLLDATHYTDGLELLNPGTSTNNSDEPSAKSSKRTPSESVESEFGSSLVGSDTDGEQLAEALGINPDVFAHVDGANDTRENAAQAMNRALWPATIGYYARNLLVFDGADGEEEDGPLGMLGTGSDSASEKSPLLLRWLETYRDHFAKYVRAGGAFQTLRIGDQPYGVLPVSPLDVSESDRVVANVPEPAEPTDADNNGFTSAEVSRLPDQTFVSKLVERTLSLRGLWLEAAESVPSVTNDSALSENDLLSILAMEATATSYRRQLWLLGDDNPLYDYANLNNDPEEVPQEVQSALNSANLPAIMPRISNLLFLGASLISEDLPITDKDVVAFIDKVVSSFELYQPDFILRWLGTSPISSDYDSTASLLRQLLRFAALQAAIASRVRIGAIYGTYTGEYVRFPAEPTSYGLDDRTVFQLFNDTIPSGRATTGDPPLFEHPQLDDNSDFRDVLRTTAKTTGTETPTPDPALGEFLDALTHLTTLDPDRLGRLTSETMDLASHRLDAWWTSLATRRLQEERARSGDGLQIAAFGFVENLSRGGGPDAEYLLAPSLDQATTASVLRSAHKARIAGDDSDISSETLAIDCSAAQIQRARPLLEGVRNGLDLAELLGYRFERGLRSLNFDQYIDDFRAFAPAVEGKLGRSDTENSAKKSDVVDGRAVYRAWKAGTLWSAPEISLKEEEKKDLGGEGPEAHEDGILQEIDAAMDAVHDVLVAEGVHHLTHGRPERAAQALESLSRGKTPPDPTVIDTPRSETGVTHRLLLLFGDASPNSLESALTWDTTFRSLLQPSQLPVHNGNSDRERSESDDDNESENDDDIPTLKQLQVRHKGEPAVNAWADDLMPNPSRIGCATEFQWERNRDFAIGSFETPAESGTLTVDDVGFEPDALFVTLVVGATTDGTTTTDAAGWSHGSYHQTTGEYSAVQCATSASVTPEGAVSHATSTDELVFVTFPDDGVTHRIKGQVVSTMAEGFELDFQVPSHFDDSETVTVQYRALQLADPTSVRIGTINIPTEMNTRSSVDLSGTGAGVSGDDFDPDHVLFSTVLPSGNNGGDPTELGLSHGEVVRTDDDGTLTQQTLGYGLAPVDDDYQVSARDDAVIDVNSGDNSAVVRLSVDELRDGTADIVVAHKLQRHQQHTDEIPITYVAIESPTVDTPAGEELRRPAIGSIAAPEDADDTVSVQTGFRPGLIEARFTSGIIDNETDDFPIEVTVDQKDTGLSIGAATGQVAQHALATGITADAGSAARSATAIGHIPTTGPTGSADGATLSVSNITDEGFDLEFGNLVEGDRPLVFYRVWPAQPDTQGFAVELDDGVGLDDLELTALDAVSLTQGVETAGDSQLERRIGYYVFRHRPENRPPIPNDATLDLSFSKTGKTHDVSIGEYIELARSVNDLIGEARPADATDLTHPSDANFEGYLDDDALGGATIDRLADRADIVEGRLADLALLLENRINVLDADLSVCDRVELLEGALRRFRWTVPVSQIVEITTRIERDHHSSNYRDIQDTILDELWTVAEHVRAGPADASGVTHVVTKEEHTVTGYVNVSESTMIAVKAYSLSDSTWFEPRTKRVSVEDDGFFTATFDFGDNVPVGTAFTVVATRLVMSDESLGQLELVEKGAVLVELASEDIYDPPDALMARDWFEELTEDVRDELDDGERPLKVFQALLDVLRQKEWSMDWFADLNDDEWHKLLDPLETAGHKRLRELVATVTQDSLLDRNFDRPTRDDWTFVDEPPRTTRTSEWTFHTDEGELQQTSNIYGFAGPPFEAPGTLAVIGDRDWTDYHLAARLTSEDNDAIGVVFRYQDPDNFYRFSMDAEREYRRLVRKIDGEAELLWEDETGFDPGREYRVAVECVGTRLMGTLDDEQLFIVRDDNLDHGAVGLYCRANKSARFHSLTVIDHSQSSMVPHDENIVYAANCRIVDADNSDGWRNLSDVVADQQYLPLLLWLSRILPDIDPEQDSSSAHSLINAVDDVSWDDVKDEPWDDDEGVPWDAIESEYDLMAYILEILENRGADKPRVFNDDDLMAVGDLVALRPLDLASLAGTVQAIVEPVAWTGFSELVTLTGDRARPDAQRPWRAGNPSLETLVKKDPEGEVRARLKRLHCFPSTDAQAKYAAYSPPVRSALTNDLIDEKFVKTIEAFVSDPEGLIKATADVAPGIVDLVTGLHDLLHHVELFDSSERVHDLRTAATAFHQAVERADPETAERLQKQAVDPGALTAGFDVYGDALKRAVGGYLTENQTTADQIEDYLSEYEENLVEASNTATCELEGRVMNATANPDIATAFRTGVLESLRRVLLRVSYFGIYGSVPASAAGGSTTDEEILTNQAIRISEEVNDRIVSSQALSPTGESTNELTVDSQVNRLQALLGEDFMVLPPFAPANPAELHGTLTDTNLVDDPYATDTWLQRISKVRNLPKSFQQIRTYADALAVANGSTNHLRRTLTAGQLPHIQGQDWLGQDSVTPSGGELSLGIDFVNEYQESSPLSSTPGQNTPGIAGLLVDEWVERTPDKQETLGLGLQYNDPSARAPQSILLATPPSWQVDHEGEAELNVSAAGPTLWTDKLVRQSLTELRELTQMRSVDLDSLNEVGHLLPMLCFPDNRETIINADNTLPDAPSIDINEFNWELF